MSIRNSAEISSSIYSQTGEEAKITTISNVSEVIQADKEILIEKEYAKTWALPDNQIEVTTTIINNSNATIENMSYIDTLSDDGTFVEGSLSIGSTQYQTYNPIVGFDIPATLGTGTSLAITYAIKTAKYPMEYSIESVCTLNLDINATPISLQSNTATLDILNNELYVLKSATPTAVISGDEITYTIVVSNNGELENSNITFKDTLPNSVTFVAGSISIDGTDHPEYTLDSFPLKNLAKNDSTTITFKVTVN